MCRIDVILPTYNHASFLPAAINAILAQTFTDFQLIIVNDGSTDNTPQVLQTFSDPRITILTHGKNLNLPTALNTGHAFGKSPYCTWVSSDNISYPEHLAALYAEIIKGYDFVQGLYKVINTFDGTHSINNAQALNNTLGHGYLGAAFLYTRAVWDTYRYNEELHGIEDLEFFLKAQKHPFKFGFVQQTLVDYYQHTRSLTCSGKLNYDNLYNRMLQSLCSMNKPTSTPTRT